VKFLVTIKQTVNYVTNTTVLCNYWYFVMATCFVSFFRPSSGQRSSVRGTISATVYCVIPHYLQGVPKTIKNIEIL